MVTDHYQAVMTDILSHAVTGELIGMQNFAALVALYDDVEEKIAAVEHAAQEKEHAMAFRCAASELDMPLIVNLQAPYWQRIRTVFLHQVQQKDVIACVLIQEAMLESFAVSMYDAVSEVAQGKLGRLFKAIAEEENGHVEHALQWLRHIREDNPAAFEDKVHRVHEDVMTILAEMVAKEDLKGHCGLCAGQCAKTTFRHVDLDIVTLRGNALNFYLTILDRLGLPGERTLEWIVGLPA